MRKVDSLLLPIVVATLLAGCAPFPATGVSPLVGAAPVLVTAPAARPAAARTVRVVAAVRPQPAPGLRLLGAALTFGPWDGSRVAKLILTVLDGGDSVASIERDGALTGAEVFEFAALKIDRLYTIQLEARAADDAVISVPEDSRAEVDTYAQDGKYPDQVGVSLPLTFGVRYWPGNVRANVSGPPGTDSIVVKLQQPALDPPGAWETLQVSTVGGATGHVDYGQLRVGQAYRVLAEARAGENPLGQTTTEFTADPAASYEPGTLPDLDLTIPLEIT